MANLHLVTGYKGAAHITSADQGVLNAMTVGVDDYVFTKGRRFEAQIISNNSVRIHDGSLMMNGRQVNLDAGSYLDAAIVNGTQGMNRHDIISIRYEIDRETNIETASLVVAQGTASSGTPTDPAERNTDSILNGVTVHDMPLYRVVLESLTIVKVEPLFQVLAPMANIQHGFYKQNMLINGDFQCNQRGHKSYTASNDVSYSVDMWRIHQVKVDVLNEGVKITGLSTASQGYFTQFIQLGKLKTTTFTISAMVDDKICTFTVTPGGTAKEKDFGKFKISALTTSTWDNDLGDYNNKLKINICPVGTSSITVVYVDVFEGDVAYPHVKEDPATALMRCRRYIQGGATVCPITYGLANSDKYQYRCAIGYEPMNTTPTLVKCDWHYYNTSGTDTTGTAATIDVKSNSSNIIQLLTQPNSQKHAQCSGIRAVYLISCEPNPNGD